MTAPQSRTTIVGQIEVSDSESDEETFEEVPLAVDDFGDEESFDVLLRNTTAAFAAPKVLRAEGSKEQPREEQIEKATVFIRTFFAVSRLYDTLCVFQGESYQHDQGAEGESGEDELVPLMYVEWYHKLSDLHRLGVEVQRLKDVATMVQKTWAQLKAARDKVKLAHMRVGQEKRVAIKKIGTRVAHARGAEANLDRLEQKIERADKERLLLELEVERLRQLEKRLTASQKAKEESSGGKTTKQVSEPEKRRLREALPADVLPFTPKSTDLSRLTHRSALSSNQGGVAGVAGHPAKKVYATGGDDGVWHVTAVEGGERLLSGRGHSAFIADVAFHPRGVHIATAGGDSTTRVWDFLAAKCVLTLRQPGVVWGCDFHHAGSVVATCGEGVRLFDLQGGAEVAVLHAHRREVNRVRWLDGTNLLVSAGADKIVALWDAREGTPIIRGTWHDAAVMGAGLGGSLLGSVDCAGGLTMRDLRKPQKELFGKRLTMPLNDCAVDPNGTCLLVAGSDGRAQVFLGDGNSWTVAQFDDSCESVAINASAELIICGGADGKVSVCTGG